MDWRATAYGGWHAFLVTAVIGVWAPGLGAQTARDAATSGPDFGLSHEFGLEIPARHDLLSNALGVGGEHRAAPNVDVDLGPLVDEVTGFLRAHGFPLHHDRQLSGDHGIVFSAAFRVDDTLPAMQFHIGDRGPLDAFYANDNGFRWALRWPIAAASQFALHLGGGENSEFGNWAIIGVQWHHPRRPLAIGIGMPIALSNSDGPVGLICQIRMLLE